ncbi:helix-turn-helix domain-containing protein [Saccharopolyspora sp. 6V]|uniref:helix-turn-helix domain-containing protein n=1 Tax=Saccharopolyspora sp. 6V TaxID=2877239 RepID=UPI001CD778C1|nr:helix-turn-helix domain-containing protein [Saccharopolyspora sp. 6V]MCA1194438.1 helix-turn-helix domain-containing protein [Saccharopolyspora sp. 6V]
MQFEGSRFYRVKAVAEMFDVSVNTIYRAIESGRLDAMKLGEGKGAVRIQGEALNHYVEQCSQAAYEAFVTGEESLSGELADNEQGSAGEVA